MLLVHCRVISPGIDLPDAAIEIRGQTIHAIYPAGSKLPDSPEIIDATGLMAMPGFIDIHTHGAGGGDACSANLNELRQMAKAKLQEGVTTFLPTTLTMPADELENTFRTVAAYRQNPEFSQVPAVHVEGPYLNANCLGAQNPAFVRVPDISEIKKLQAIAPIGIISLAAEVPGGMEFIRDAATLGIVTSLAHTGATYAEFLKAKLSGLTHLTHFCNQMTPLHHREIGIVGAGLLDPDILIELICDKLHLSSDMIRLVFQTKQLSRLMLITDSIAASHLGEGNFQIGGLPVTVRNGEARLGNGALAGSTLKLNEALRNVFELTGKPLSELVRTTSWNQAQSLGYDRLGKLEPGFQADLVLLNPDFSVNGTLIQGAWKNETVENPLQAVA